MNQGMCPCWVRVRPIFEVTLIMWQLDSLQSSASTASTCHFTQRDSLREERFPVWESKRNELYLGKLCNTHLGNLANVSLWALCIQVMLNLG